MFSFSTFLCLFATNKLHLSLYTHTASGNPRQAVVQFVRSGTFFLSPFRYLWGDIYFCIKRYILRHPAYVVWMHTYASVGNFHPKPSVVWLSVISYKVGMKRISAVKPHYRTAIMVGISPPWLPLKIFKLTLNGGGFRCSYRAGKCIKKSPVIFLPLKNINFKKYWFRTQYSRLKIWSWFRTPSYGYFKTLP